MRFPYGISCSLLHNFLLRLPYEMSLCNLSRFAAYFSDEISCFLAVMRCPCELVCFLLHTFRTRYPDEISCFFLGFAHEISCLFGHDAISWRDFMLFGCRIYFWRSDVRTMERWMLKDAGDRLLREIDCFTMVYWTLRGFVCASWVVRWR